MIKTFQLQDISIEVTRKRIKNLHLRILQPDGKVKISAPLRMSFKYIYDFAVSKFEWIHMNQRKIQARKPALGIHYVEGETHLFLDKSYYLKLIETHTFFRIELENDFMILFSPSEFCKEKKQALVEKFYKMQLKEILLNLIAKWESIINVKVNQFSIRKMKTRWGSCSYKTSKIRFNLALAKHSLECIEYIVVHEMVHLLEPSHNHRFKALMNQFMPEWRVHQNKLKNG